MILIFSSLETIMNKGSLGIMNFIQGQTSRNNQNRIINSIVVQ